MSSFENVGKIPEVSPKERVVDDKDFIEAEKLAEYREFLPRLKALASAYKMHFLDSAEVELLRDQMCQVGFSQEDLIITELNWLNAYGEAKKRNRIKADNIDEILELEQRLEPTLKEFKKTVANLEYYLEQY